MIQYVLTLVAGKEDLVIELPVADLINLAEAAGIIATLFVIFYFSRNEECIY
jgi:hypothetical protein